ncbi:MAG: type II toxin-antitoxin system prevent-host-death family antitoxin [Actinomycetota bacterium]|nr:type II toxin-antitoxin system prevent-host-death family antitoxin [Actinomycetota bacterium]MDA8075358.1 type II toxin-antitoxin system prevent-host-death family antitoxin [Actinomycetota bacterium]
MKVGVRELRNNLSRYLDRVRAGDEVVVTDHGREIARVVPIGNGEREPGALDRLVAEGLVAAPLKARRPLPSRGIQVSEAVSPLVSEQRG